MNIWQIQTKHFNGQLLVVASAASEYQILLDSLVNGLSIPSRLSKVGKSRKEKEYSFEQEPSVLVAFFPLLHTVQTVVCVMCHHSDNLCVITQICWYGVCA